MGTPDSVAQKAALIVADLESHLLTRHTVLRLDRVNEPRISAAVDWLRSVMNPNGSWGSESSTATCICALALTLWKEPGRDKHVTTSAHWLLQSSRDGAWETPWESAVAIRALERAGLGNHPIVIRGKERLLSINPAEADLKPHHRAQILNLITELRAYDLGESWVARCDADLTRSNSPYVMGQIVHALLSANSRSNNCDVALKTLQDFTLSGPPEAATFLPYIASLQALSCSGGKYEETAGIALDHIFTDAHRKDGSWYHDPWYTGWAICVLHEVQAVRRLVIDAPAFAREFQVVHNRIAELSTIEIQHKKTDLRSRRQVAACVAVLVLLAGAGAAILIDWQANNPIFSSGLIITVILGMVGLFWRVLWALLSDLSNR